ncbi:lamin tail domain-containing protein [Nonomuraea sp. NPDC048901]|uniref:lamin tail domain-containing protein n=1 Tax=Nonomuraea sp. NPDC048901 TaxID=3155627 RepID=UPI0034022C7A
MTRPALLTLATTVTMLVAVAPPAQAATPIVEIVKVYYDSPGKDTRSNASLNAEYVVLKNNSNVTVQMMDWIVRDETGYKYRFPFFSLKSGKTVTIRSGKGADTTTTKYWGRASYVWNNTGDTASLYWSSGPKRVDVCRWKRGSGSTNCA